MGTVEYILIGVVVVIVLALAGILIWHFAFRKHGNVQGEPCTSNDDCAAMHFCAGNGQCQEGTTGGTSGADCTDSSQCMAGLTCQSNRCSSTVTPPSNNIGSFTNSHITIQDQGTTKFLHLIPSTPENVGSSEWLTGTPSIAFTYNSSTNEITVSGTQTGTLFVNSFGLLQTGTASKFFFVKQSDGMIKLEDGFSNQINLATGEEAPAAAFIDQQRYISQQNNFAGNPVFVSIVPASMS